MHRFKGGGLRPDALLDEVDEYGCITKTTAFYYNECAFHYSKNHSLSCSVKPIRKTTDFDKQVEAFKNKTGCIVNVTWQCQYVLTKEYETLRSSLDVRCQETLCMRSAMRDALYEVFCMYFNYTTTSAAMQYKDCVSLYPSIAMDCHFVVGKAFHICDVQSISEQITFKDGKYLLNGSILYGVALCRITPPCGKDIRAPFPLISTKCNGRNLNLYCYTCGNNKQLTPCSHTAFERSFVGNLTFEEINYAKAELNYDFQLFEITYYTETKKLYSKFFKFLLYYKLKFSGFPHGLSENKRAEFCNSVEKAMNFKEIGLEFSPDVIENSPSKRFYFKKISVSVIGKFAVNHAHFRNISYTTRSSDLLRAFRSKTLHDFEAIDDNTLKIIETTEQSRNRSNCIMHGIQITSQSRIKVYKQMMELHTQGYPVFLVNNDSIGYLVPEGKAEPLPEQLGIPGTFQALFKEQKILSFMGISPRFYSFSYLHDGQVKVINKLSGVSISRHLEETFDTGQAVKALFSNLVEHTVATLPVMQTRTWGKKKTDKKEVAFRIVKRNHVFSKDLYARRKLVSKSDYYHTLPYGMDN